MHYKLYVTDEMYRLLDESVAYLLDKLMNKQAALHLLAEVDKIYSFLMDNILIYKILDDKVYILGIYNCRENYIHKLTLIWKRDMV